MKELKVGFTCGMASAGEMDGVDPFEEFSKCTKEYLRSLERQGVSSNPSLLSLEWHEVAWSGMEWHGVAWSVLERHGVTWSGMESRPGWSGMVSRPGWTSAGGREGAILREVQAGQVIV
jgi:hypothetical protein